MRRAIRHFCGLKWPPLIFRLVGRLGARFDQLISPAIGGRWLVVGGWCLVAGAWRYYPRVINMCPCIIAVRLFLLVG